MLTRRQILLALAAILAGSAAPSAVFAKDGDDDGDSSSGSGSSGSDDRDDRDDRGDDSGRGRGRGGDDDDDDHDEDDARRAVSGGEALPLRDALAKLRKTHSGRVIDADLKTSNGRLIYRFKVVEDRGVVRTVEMDARTGKLRSLFGF